MANPPSMSESPRDDRIRQLLALPEDENLDFKRVGNVDSIVKTACAQANGGGGLIVLGVEDGKKAKGRDRVYGVQEKPECIGEIRRAFVQRITPPLVPPHCAEVVEQPLRVTLRDGAIGTVLLLHVPRSGEVHSVVDGGTYSRIGAQNRQLSARETTELSLRRGTQSAVDAPVDVPIELLDTSWYRQYAKQRKLTRPVAQALRHLGLVIQAPGGGWQPRRAAVLLFAENPGGLLNQKCAVRVFHYRGHQVEHNIDTNLVRPPVTVDGPVLRQIREAVRLVELELQAGVQVSAAGFAVRQKFPMRVVQEAITNAVIHRDYRLSQDIHVRIFANRIEVENPGVFPGSITAATVREARSKPRNPSIVDHLREFAEPPNLDAGEGVRMMYATLERQGLYPPLYRSEEELGREVVQVDLRNEARHSTWELVDDYLAAHDSITNADVRRIANIGANVAVSKLLREWVEAGLLRVENPDAGTRLRRYGRVGGPGD